MNKKKRDFAYAKIKKMTTANKKKMKEADVWNVDKTAVTSCCHLAICSITPIGQIDACCDINRQPDIMPCSSVCMPITIPNVAARVRPPASIIADMLHKAVFCHRDTMIWIISVI